MIQKEMKVDFILQCTQTTTCKIKFKVKELEKKNIEKFLRKYWSKTKTKMLLNIDSCNNIKAKVLHRSYIEKK